LHVTASYSQGAYLDKGTDGFGVGLAFARNTEVEGLTWTAGYSDNGILDISASVTKLRIGYERPLSWGFALTFYPVKQHMPTWPLSIAIEAAVNITTEGGGTVSSLGIYLLKRIRLSRIVSLQPLVGAIYAGSLEAQGQSKTAFALGLPVVFKPSQKTMLVITPGVVVDEDYGTPGIGLELIFTIPEKTIGALDDRDAF